MAAVAFLAGAVLLDAGVCILAGFGWALVTAGAFLAGPGILGQIRKAVR